MMSLMIKNCKEKGKNDSSENIAPNKTTKGKVVKDKSNAQAEARKIVNQTCLKALEIDTSSMKDVSNICHPFLVSKELPEDRSNTIQEFQTIPDTTSLQTSSQTQLATPQSSKDPNQSTQSSLASLSFEHSPTYPAMPSSSM